jgi:hypothetical protein
LWCPAAGGGVDGGGVVGGDVVGVGDIVGDGDVVGVGEVVGVGFVDLVGDAGGFVVVLFTEGVGVVSPTLLPGKPPPPLSLGGVVLAFAAVLGVGAAELLWVGAVVELTPRFEEVLLLLEISTAMIATTPMAAAPMPANKKVRFPGPREPGCGLVPF